MPSSSGGMQAIWTSVGVCIDILFIADISDEDTPNSAKIWGSEETCDEAVFSFATIFWRGLNEKREGMVSSSSCIGVSDAESWSSPSSYSVDDSTDCESSPELDASDSPKLSSPSSLTRFCLLRGPSSWRRIRSSVVRGLRLLLGSMLSDEVKQALGANLWRVLRAIGTFFDHNSWALSVPPRLRHRAGRFKRTVWG